MTIEYMSDFVTVCERALTDPLEQKLFKFHFLLGADYKLYCRRFGLGKDQFFSIVKRIQDRVGHALWSTEPYSLFPVAGYFARVPRGTHTSASTPPVLRMHPVLRPPVQKAVA